MTEIVQYHVGEMVTGLVKTALVPGGVEVLLYSTIMGGIGILIPFASREVSPFLHILVLTLSPSAILFVSSATWQRK